MYSSKNKVKHVIKIICIIIAALTFVFAGGCEGIFDSGTVTISQKAATVKAGENIKLTATSSEGRKISWYSSDEDIADVEDGLVTAYAVGTAKITADDGKKQAVCVVTVTEADEPVKVGYKLVWSDEFDGDSLDMTKWNYQTGTRDIYGDSKGAQDWGNGELQYYTDGANVNVADGLLEIIAKKESMENKEYTSSRIVTRDNASWTYGYFEARIKLPTVSGMWPAFWMLPQPTDKTSTKNVYGGWPTSGEIDIMEAKGRLEKKSSGALHYNSKSGGHDYTAYDNEFANSTIAEWHVYAVEWTPDYLSLYVDGECFGTVENSTYYSAAAPDNASAPFDQPFYLLLNLAVDSGRFDSGAKLPQDFTSASMFVDYVRVYQKR